MYPRKHFVAGFRVLLPEFLCLGIDRTELPLPKRVFATPFKSTPLFVRADIEIVLDQLKTAMDQQLFEQRNRNHELFIFLIRTKSP